MLRLLLALTMIGTPVHSFACSCFFQVSCQIPKNGSAVFVGTVLDVTDVPQSKNKFEFLTGRKVRIQVEEWFTASKGTVVEVFTGKGGGDCGINFKPGERYLVDASQWKGRLSTGVCSRTQKALYAGALIRELRKSRAGEKVPALFGVLESAPGYGSDVPNDKAPATLSGVRLTFRSEKTEVSAMTDAEGVYELFDLPQGSYSVTADLPTNRALRNYEGSNDGPLPIQVNGSCLQSDIQAFPTGKIYGSVFDEDGKPLYGAVMTMFPAGKQEAAEYSPWQSPFETTGEKEGVFEFPNVAEGDYIAVFNPRNELNDPWTPYPKTYYPNSRSREGAIPVHVSDGQSVRIDFHLAGGAPRRELHITVLNPDGTPAPEAVSESEDLAVKSDVLFRKLGSGQFALPIFIGHEYKIQAHLYEFECSGPSSTNELYSESVLLKADDQETSTLTLHLEGKNCKKK